MKNAEMTRIAVYATGLLQDMPHQQCSALALYLSSYVRKYLTLIDNFIYYIEDDTF